MCCPSDCYRPIRPDDYFGHQLVSHKFANYITRSPILHRPPSCSPCSSPETELPLDLYIARVIHASRVPDIVAYTALYLLASISQTCQCTVPHHTRFSQVIQPHWGERHLFMGAFVLILSAYKVVFEQESHQKLRCWAMIGTSGISEEEIVDVCYAFRGCMSDELGTAVKSMLWDRYVVNVSEPNSSYVCACQRRSANGEDGNENGKGKKKRMCLKRCVSSIWKPREKASPVDDSEPHWSYNSVPHRRCGESAFLF